MTLPSLFSFLNSGVSSPLNSTLTNENSTGLPQQPLSGVDGLTNALAYRQPLAGGVNGFANALAYQLLNINLGDQQQSGQELTGFINQVGQSVSDQGQLNGNNLPLFEQILPFISQGDQVNGLQDLQLLLRGKDMGVLSANGLQDIRQDSSNFDAEYLADLLQQQLPQQKQSDLHTGKALSNQINTQINEETSPIYASEARLQENNKGLLHLNMSHQNLKNLDGGVNRPVETMIVSTVQQNDMQNVQGLGTVLKSGLREQITEIVKDSTGKRFSDPSLKVSADMTSNPIQNQYGLDSIQRQFNNIQHGPQGMSANIQIPVGKSGWSSAVAERVALFSANNIGQAKISLEPPELGPLSVKISINNDQANVSFVSPHGVVREAVEQSVNRLQELLHEHGLNLVNVDISGQSDTQSQDQNEHNANKDMDVTGDGILDDDKQTSSNDQQLGLIDDFV